MDGATFIQRFREETADEGDPPLWADGLILRYLSEAVDAFYAATEGIEDSISGACVLDVPAGGRVVSYNPRIKKIRSASLAGANRPMRVMSVDEARRDGVALASTRVGEPHTLILGVGPNSAQVVPIPNEPVQIHLDVFRLPLCERIGKSDHVEVLDEALPTVMQYALYRAYSRPDPDTMDRTRADYFFGQFNIGVMNAVKAQGRLRKPNGSTVFSW